MPSDFKATELYKYAESIADQTIRKLSVYMHEHPDEYPDFVNGCSRILHAEHAIEQRLGKEANLVYELGDAHFTRSNALEMALYIQGVLDGGRIYCAMMSGELPRKEEDNV